MKIKTIKIFLYFFMAAVFCVNGFSASMNPEKGYKNLDWGTTVKDAQKEGFKLSILSSDNQISIFFQQTFSEKVDVYFVKPTEKKIIQLYFIYYKEKFFCAYETFEDKKAGNATLKSRYGGNITNGFDENFFFLKNKDNTVNGNFNITGNIINACLFEPDTFYKIAVTENKKSAFTEKSSDESADFVKQFDSLAQKLLQEPKNGEKASYAFLDFSTDNKSASIEKYITDALTEAVFNTGKVKIIERANLEKILNEQKLQASGLVNESEAANIGNIAGVEYVCYGKIKTLENGYTISARVVDVESGEICAMSRTTIAKDSYLAEAENTRLPSAKTSAAQTAKKSVKSLWKCTKNRNEFDGYTTYTFILKGPQEEFLFLGYDKNDVPSRSIVRAGVHWDKYWYHGTLDFKTDSKEVISKKFRSIKGYSSANWSQTTGWKGGKDEFHFSYNEDESARFFINLFEENSYLTVRNGNEVRRFQTEGFWDTVESYGITKQEILDAVANEEF